MPTSRGSRNGPGEGGAAEAPPLQREARALGDPTRHEIFRLIQEGPEPATVTVLADHLELHPSAVRQHLAKLLDAGLVVEERRPPAGPGRPPLRYRAAPAAFGRWGSESPYERLALLLLEVARSGRPAREVGEEAGRFVGRHQPGGEDPVGQVEEVVTQLGFEPRRAALEGGAALVFGRCPYAAAAAADPMVCELHHGLAEGLARELGGVEVVALHRRDPYEAGCRLDLCTDRLRPAPPPEGFDSKRS